MGKQMSDGRPKGRGIVAQRLAGSLEIPRRQVATAPFRQEDYPQFRSVTPLSQLFSTTDNVGVVIDIQGAFAVVFECHLQGSNSRIALKRVKVASETVLRLCIHEFEVLRELNHPHIVHAHRLLLDEDSASAYLLLDFISGKTLAELLHERHSFTEAEVRVIARQLFNALAYLEERRLVHRDIHPGNVLVAEGVVSLIDFQTCVCEDACNGLVGTAPYHAPEMWSGCPYNCKADVWSAGTLIARLLRDAVTELTPACRDFLSACTEPSPNMRVSASNSLRMSWMNDKTATS